MVRRAWLCAVLCALWGCGNEEALTPEPQSAVGFVACAGLAGDTPVFEVRITAVPLEPLGRNTAFEVQGEINITQEILDDVAHLAGVATLEEASVELDQVGGDDPIILAAEVPDELNFTTDSDEDGAPGPISVTTAVGSALWTARNGSLAVEATNMSFRLSKPVLITASTGQKIGTGGQPAAEPGCSWLEVPQLVFESVSD